MSVITIIMYIFLLVLFFSVSIYIWEKYSKADGNLIYGVTLPEYAINDEKVLGLKESFRRLCAFWSIIFMLLSLPSPLLCALLPKHKTAALMYTIICLLIFPAVTNRPCIVIRRRLLELKRRNKWFYGVTREVNIDTQAAILKNSRVAPAWLFLLSAAIPAAGLIICISEHIQFGLAIAACASIFSNLLFFWLYTLTKKRRSNIISTDSDINVAYNCKKQSLLSYFWVGCAFADSLECVLSWPLISIPKYGACLFAGISMLFCFFIFALIIHMYKTLRCLENEFRDGANMTAVTDDDEYWKDNWYAGMYYSNPNDSSMMVEKRYGVGMTINFGTKKGKAFIIGVFAFVAVVLCFALSLPILFAMNAPKLTIDSSTKMVNINTFMYNTSFKESDIKSVTTINTMPDRIKTNGSGTSDAEIGHFNIDGYGDSLEYIHCHITPFIVIKLNNGDYIFYNDFTKAQTMDDFNELRNFVKN